MSAKPFLKVTSDFTDHFNEVVEGFKGEEVLIGIPEDTTARKKDEDAPINNATLLAINEFGSPGQNIPPRPVMSIGLKNARDAIGEEFKKAAKAALKDGLPAIQKYFERAGIVAANSVKKAINDQDGIDAPSDATLATRKAMGFKGTKALVVTGQMRNAITSVVNTKWGGKK